MIDRIRNEICVGCKACQDICPRGAINFREDKEGFWYPGIDYDKCIECNRCEKACPVSDNTRNKDKRKVVKPKVYAAYHKNRKIRYYSTSGGVYNALAAAILAKGGYLIGCAYTRDYRGAHHIAVSDGAGLRRLMGSKYFQSDTQGIYRITEKLLKEDQTVLFTGTPCQIAALKGFLGIEYEKLYTCDFICRGINSPLAYRKYIEELEGRYRSRMKRVHFKNKKQGWTSLGTLVSFENGKTYFGNKYTDPWVNAFIADNLSIRPSCSGCRFKKLPRESDITIGDFWGLEVTKEDEALGVSAILVNREKGHELLNRARRILVLEEHSFREVLQGNPALLHAVHKGNNRDEFFRRIKNEKYSTVVWDLLGLRWPRWQFRSYHIWFKRQTQKCKQRLLR